MISANTHATLLVQHRTSLLQIQNPLSQMPLDFTNGALKIEMKRFLGEALSHHSSRGRVSAS